VVRATAAVALVDQNGLEAIGDGRFNTGATASSQGVATSCSPPASYSRITHARQRPDGEQTSSSERSAVGAVVVEETRKPSPSGRWDVTLCQSVERVTEREIYWAMSGVETSARE
jgi:hypothetical protein